MPFDGIQSSVHRKTLNTPHTHTLLHHTLVVPVSDRYSYIRSTATKRVYRVSLSAPRDAVNHTVSDILRDIKDRTIHCADLLVLLDTNASSSAQADKKNLSDVMEAVKKMMDTQTAYLNIFRISVERPMVTPPYDLTGSKSTHLVVAQETYLHTHFCPFVCTVQWTSVATPIVCTRNHPKMSTTRD